MLRSPIFIILFLVFVFSCSENSKSNKADAGKRDFNSVLARKYLEKGDFYSYTKKKFDSAFYYYNSAKEIYALEKDTLNVVYNLLQMARAQQTFGDYMESEVTLTEAEPYIQSIRDYEKKSEYNTFLKNLYGVASKELSNYNDALKYYTEAKKDNTAILATIALDNNIAAVHILRKEYKVSIKILEDILKFKELDTLKKKRAIYLDNLGFAYYKAKEETKGLHLMQQALKDRVEENDSYGIIESYLHLSEYYQDKDLWKAKQNALLAYEVATKNNSIDERLEALGILMSYNQEIGKNKYAAQYAFLNDSITTLRNRVKNQYAKIKYDSRKEKEENLVLKTQKAEAGLQLEKQKNQKNIFLFGFILLVAGIAYIINYFRNKNKRERIEVQYKTETTISKKLHDELANDVFHTMTFAETQDLQNPEKREILLGNLDKIYSRTRNISGENSVVDTGEKFEAHLKEMISSYKSNQVNIIIRDNKDIDWLTVAPEKKIAVHRIVQELLVNMKKHSQCNLTVISFVQKEKQIEIHYSDNGKGIEKVNLKNGLQNMENRIHGIKGTITFDSEVGKGFKVKISFPK